MIRCAINYRDTTQKNVFHHLKHKHPVEESSIVNNQKYLLKNIIMAEIP